MLVTLHATPHLASAHLTSVPPPHVCTTSSCMQRMTAVSNSYPSAHMCAVDHPNSTHTPPIRSCCGMQQNVRGIHTLNNACRSHSHSTPTCTLFPHVNWTCCLAEVYANDPLLCFCSPQHACGCTVFRIKMSGQDSPIVMMPAVAAKNCCSVPPQRHRHRHNSTRV